MHRFFVSPGQVGETGIVITGDDVNHIRNVLRMRQGERILILDGTGMEYECVIKEISRDKVSAEKKASHFSKAELKSDITLYQGLPKGDKTDFIIQKCVELGVYRIVFVDTARSVVKLDAKREASRLKRWRSLAKSAAKQSGRAIIPEVSGVISFSDAVDEALLNDAAFMPYEKAEDISRTREAFGKLQKGCSIGILIGPEGGFEESEAEYAKASGIETITLGRRILRTETAGASVMSILAYLLEDD